MVIAIIILHSHKFVVNLLFFHLSALSIIAYLLAIYDYSYTDELRHFILKDIQGAHGQGDIPSDGQALQKAIASQLADF